MPRRPVSDQQRAANRANAQRATGPRTAEGKAIASQNAVKHGVLANAMIPRALEPYESQADLDALIDGLNQAFAPVDRFESLLVQQIAQASLLARLLAPDPPSSRRGRRHRPAPAAQHLRHPAPAHPRITTRPRPRQPRRPPPPARRPHHPAPGPPPAPC